MSKSSRMAVVAWLLAVVYYFFQYTLRSCPSVMMPELSQAFGISALAVASMVALFYYGYSPFSLVAGAALDRLGARKVIPFGTAAVGIGALLFSTGNQTIGSIGRILQGAGGVFALIGAIYIANRHFSATKAATLIGATQMFGMAGGSAGQFAVGPLIGAGVSCQSFWIGMGVAGIAIGFLLWFLMPKDEPVKQEGSWVKNATNAFKVVFTNPQSILCGLIAGLLFIPTTIFDMIWGVRFLQDAHGFDFGSAVMRSASVPFGWIIGCPLLGFISDRIGRRKPVIIGGAVVLLACLSWILYGRVGIFPPFSIGIVTGIASGAAMLPYTVIKEANPPQFSGTATGVVNFINFTLSALLGPVFGWILVKVTGPSADMEMIHYQVAFKPLLYGVAIAIVLTLILKETGPAAKKFRTERKFKP
ncbi:MAG: MFS transporter [Bacteroidetes bacterium]|nr:MFS transporter [Bacteroidota bacterium]